MCAGGALVCFGGLCSLSEHSFVSDVSFGHFLFFFLFLFDYQMCVLSIHSSRGRLRTMCGLRIGGWSLPGVTSD
jgi:hypothetical protein